MLKRYIIAAESGIAQMKSVHAFIFLYIIKYMKNAVGTVLWQIFVTRADIYVIFLQHQAFVC